MNETYKEGYNPFPKHSEIYNVAENLISAFDKQIKHGRYLDMNSARASIHYLLSRTTDNVHYQASDFIAEELNRGIKFGKNTTPYKELLNENVRRLHLNTWQKQKMLAKIVGYRIHCEPKVFESLSSYPISSPEEATKHLLILDNCVSKAKEKNGDTKLKLYMPVIENSARNAKNLNIPVTTKLDLIDLLIEKETPCSANCSDFLGSYVPDNAINGIRHNKILHHFEKDSQCPDYEYSKLINGVVKGFCGSNPNMSMQNFVSCSNIFMNILQNQYAEDISLMPIAKLLEDKAKQRGFQEYELFSEQKMHPDTLDKRCFSQFLDLLLDKTKENGGIKKCNPRFLTKTAAFVVAMINTHSFSKKEMREISKKFKGYHYGSETTEAHFFDLNTSLQQLYNKKQATQIDSLNKWIGSQKISSELEKKALRSVYVDIVHERLINDTSIATMNPEQAYQKRLESLQENPDFNSNNDDIKAQRIGYALEGFYKHKPFTKKIVATLKSLEAPLKASVEKSFSNLGSGSR